MNIQDANTAMAEISCGGQLPSIKLAYWASAASLKMKLHLNGRYTRVLAGYVNKPLPAREVLLDELGRKPGGNFPQGMMGQHVDLFYEIERLDNLGLLNFDAGFSLESQRLWRDKTVALIHGMGCKLVSWALFIYAPHACLLLTIDKWHCKRMGIDQAILSGSSDCKRREYFVAEERLLAECRGLYPEYPPVIVAAFLWEQARKLAGESKGEIYESHAELSCRWY